MLKDNLDKEKIKIAFNNVKDDILILKKEIENIKSDLLEIKKNIAPKEEISKGNEGVVIMPLLSRYYDVIMPKENIGPIEVKDLKKLDEEIKKFITSLTDKEFLIFMAIYQIEDELKRPVTYEDLSRKLGLSLFSLRNRISGLIIKGAPITKEKLHNYKAMFSINQKFKDLRIIDKLIELRRNFDNQTSLSRF